MGHGEGPGACGGSLLAAPGLELWQGAILAAVSPALAGISLLQA